MYRQLASSKAAVSQRVLAARVGAHAQKARSFHTPFASLAQTSPLTNPPAHGSDVFVNSYEKQAELTPEPSVSHNGQKTYVVSDPDPKHTPYEVPSGAFATSAPYAGNKSAASSPGQSTHSSSSSTPAHPNTTNRVPQNESGVGESAAVRWAEAPGEMGARGGSRGGVGLMDEGSTSAGKEGDLADRNPPPLKELSEEFSKKGLEGAWKVRK